MLKKICPIAKKLEENRWIIASFAAVIAVLAAAISVIVYFSKKSDKAECETEDEEDCFIE